ncbi:hypothetical protein MAFF211271_15100 [Ralstonia syzygii subsp. indonesiensis]|nr:hypothetical protein MAFF211271_15100 [Ralstonia pseudosolanacearum]
MKIIAPANSTMATSGMNMNQLVVHSRARRVIHSPRGMFGRTLSSGGNSGAGTGMGVAAAGGCVAVSAGSGVTWEGESMMGGRTPEFCGRGSMDICATAQNQV